MNAKSSPPTATNNDLVVRLGPDDAIVPASPVADRACCCTSRAAVRVIMPPTTARPHATDLLLCAHHYRVSRQALAAARATICQLPDVPSDVSAWLDLGQPAASPRG